MDSTALWNSYRSGNRDAIGELYRALHPRLLLFCLGKLRDSAKAEDAASETLNKLLTTDKADEIRNVEQWLFTVAKNHCFSHLSTEKRHREIESGMQAVMAGNTRPEGEANVQSEQLQAMRQETLTEKEPKVWDLHEQGYNNQEIGSRLDMQDKTVSNHKANARVKLRELLRKLQRE